MQFFSLSLLVPIAYLGILVSSLATFSHLYRQRKITAKLRLEPYFPEHNARNVYLSLMHLPDADATNKSVPESVLRAALLNRAVEDIMRLLEIRTRKNVLNQLLQRGVVGDEMWQRLLRAEQELELELKDVVSEANALAPNWGQSIFQSASEMAQNRLLKEKLDKIKASIPAEKDRWEKQREASRRELEGDDGTESDPKKAHIANAVMDKVPKDGASDEDGVIVETPGADASGAASGGGGAKKNKKKNKK